MPRAIDVHIHPPRGVPSSQAEQIMSGYFKSGLRPADPSEMADYYTERDIFGVLVDIDDSSQTGRPFTGNDYIASLVQRWPKQFLGFASVDPHQGRLAVRELERAVNDLGLRGLKLHASMQRFFPNDRAFYPLWEKAAELGIPVMFHSGMTGVGARTPGGSGIKFEYCRPIPYIDDIAADFPLLQIIMAHPAFPWVTEQLAILNQYANFLISDRVLFGSDYPVIQPDRWLRDWNEVGFRDEVRRGILFDNANRLLGLNLEYTGDLPG
ncbi:MAG: amidohydrolase [Chloroflexi bacterium CFX7]|nr:amidohydrolase [Chloroflexi bacterium CFX7]